MRRDPLTMTEVAKLFRDEVKTRYDPPSETQLAVLLFNLSGRIAQLDLEFIAALRPLSQAAADFSHYGWHTYQAIEALTAIRPDWSMEMPVIARNSAPPCGRRWRTGCWSPCLRSGAAGGGDHRWVNCTSQHISSQRRCKVAFRKPTHHTSSH